MPAILIFHKGLFTVSGWKLMAKPSLKLNFVMLDPEWSKGFKNGHNFHSFGATGWVQLSADCIF